MTSAGCTTRTRRFGARSASAARLIHAAMCAWSRIGATRGKPLKRNPVTRMLRRRRTAVSADSPHDAQHVPRGKNGRAPDVFRPGAWIPMREYPQDEAVDFAIV